MSNKTCLVITSEVMAGYVGARAVLPALAAVGVEAWTMPTILLSGHAATPGVARLDVAGADLVAGLAQGFRHGARLRTVDAVLTGYLRDRETAKAVAGIARECGPDCLRICDPVLGDDGALYLPADVGEVLREEILPEADMALPNVFELGWLTRAPVETLDDIIAAARTLGPRVVCVTSVQRDGEIGLLTVTSDAATFAGRPRRDRRFNGAGDVVSGLITGFLLDGVDPHEASRRTVAIVDRLAELTPPDRDDLAVLQLARPGTIEWYQ